MKGLLQTASISLLALLVGVGCSSSQSPDNVAVEPTEPTTAAPIDEAEETPQFEGRIFVPGLIPSADAEAIIASSGQEPGRSRGIDDPFKIIPVGAIDRSEPIEVPETPGAQPAATNPGATEPLPEPPPQPSKAQAVTITGVVRVGNTVRAIVQSPDEPTSRHVGVGQFIAGGDVLVKQIDIDGATPTVVLEEVGMEVFKPVGEGLDTSSLVPASTTAAVIPPPPPSIY